MKSLVSSISLSITAVLLFFATNSNAQVGIGTSIPQAAMDVTSTNAGLLLPRIALTSATVVAPVTNPNGGAVVAGTMVWNTGTGGVTPAGYYYWENSRWNQVKNSSEPSVYFGKFIITAAGTTIINGLPFSPKSVEFLAVNRIQGYNSSYRSDSNNSNDIRMAGGQTMGYAQLNGAMINQQVVSSGANGSSINNIGTYASDAHCLAAFFVDNNGGRIRDNGTSSGGNASENQQEGLIRASLTSFDLTGFTLNVDRFVAGSTSNNRTNQIVVIYKAYR